MMIFRLAVVLCALLFFASSGNAANTTAPTVEPTAAPIPEPTASPTSGSTAAPTTTNPPTPNPTASPTSASTLSPTTTSVPTPNPSASPTAGTTLSPTTTSIPTPNPSAVPTASVTLSPTATSPPTANPSAAPTSAGTLSPTTSSSPTAVPTVEPIAFPTPVPTLLPTQTSAPSAVPTLSPTFAYVDFAQTGSLNGENLFGYDVEINDDGLIIVGVPAAGQVMVYSSSNFQYTLVDMINGSASTEFGYSIAISGSYLVVGAPNDVSGQGSGSVTVYSNSGTGNVYTQSGSVVHGDAVSQSFGGAVAAYGNLFAVGAFNTQDTSYIGVVYIYSFDANTQLQLVQVASSASTTKYSGSMSMSSVALVVGDYSYGTQNGAVFVLANQMDSAFGANFTLVQTLTTPVVSARFGQSVSISGSILAVGTPQYSDQIGGGSVYMFATSSDDDYGYPSFAQVEWISSNVGGFGYSVGLDFSAQGDGLLAIGGYVSGSPGTVFVYEQQLSAEVPWNKVQTLAHESSSVGFSVAISVSQGLALSGNPSGESVFIFSNAPVPSPTPSPTSSPTQGYQQFTQVAIISNGASFGYSLALSATGYLLIGKPNSNQVVVYEQSSDESFVAVQSLNGSTTSTEFGYAMAAAGEFVAIGAPLDGHAQGSGAVYVYANVLTSSTNRNLRSSSSASTVVFELTASLSGDAVSQAFGGAIAAYGSMLAVGAFNTNEQAAGYLGVVYIFDLSTGSQLQMITLLASATTTKFPGSMSFYGASLVVGDYSYGSQNGAVFVLTNQDTDASNFSLTQTLTYPVVGSRFGWSVSVVDGTLAVGAPGQTFVNVYTASTDGIFSLSSTIQSTINQFGYSVSLAQSASGQQQQLAVGATNSTFGAVVTYINVAVDQWTQQQMLSSSGAHVGYSVALSLTEQLLVTGAPDVGTVLVFSDAVTADDAVDDLPADDDDSSGSSKKGLSDGAVAGVVIGSIAGAVLIGSSVYYFGYARSGAMQQPLIGADSSTNKL